MSSENFPLSRTKLFKKKNKKYLVCPLYFIAIACSLMILLSLDLKSLQCFPLRHFVIFGLIEAQRRQNVEEENIVKHCLAVIVSTTFYLAPFHNCSI